MGISAFGTSSTVECQLAPAAAAPACLRSGRMLTSSMPPSRSGSPGPGVAAGRRADPSWIGRSFEGRYRIEAQLGDGGVGRVYRARHLRLDRAVALKVLRKQHNERWVSRQRFEREARALGQLSHPNIVAVMDSGIDVDVPFLVMELLEGQDLASALRHGALAPRVACRHALELL